MIENGEEQEDDEDYNYINKQLSRKEVYNYIKEKAEKYHFKPFSELKLLILSHIKGNDLLEIYYPLGILPKNITVVEIETDVVNQMKQNPIFANVEIINDSLENFVMNNPRRFHIYHLDFKGTITRKRFVEIILPFILIAQHFYVKDEIPTIFYLNFLGAREVRDITESYRKLELDVNKSAKHIESTRTILEKNVTTKSVRRTKSLFDKIDNLRRINNIDKKLEELEEKTDQKNKHWYRADFLYLMLKEFLDYAITYFLPEWHINEGCFENYELNQKIKDKGRHFHNTIAYLRGVMKIPELLEFYTFKYSSRKNHPFLSCLFMMDNIFRIVQMDGVVKRYFQYEIEQEKHLVDIDAIKRDNKEVWATINQHYSDLEYVCKKVFEKRDGFIYDSLIAFNGIKKYLKKEIKQNDLMHNFIEFTSHFFDKKTEISNISSEIHDYYIMALKIYKLLTDNQCLSFNQRVTKGKRITEAKFNILRNFSAIVDSSIEELRVCYLRFVVTMDILAKANDWISKTNEIAKVIDISQKS